MTMPSTTLITADHPKGRQAVDLFRATYNKMGLDENRAQRLNENGGEFQKGLRELIEQHSNPDQFAEEEETSSYGYLSGYAAPKLLEEQITRLKELFPELAQSTADLSIGSQPVPPNAEGYFVIPRWQLFGKTYAEAVQKVLDKIKDVRQGAFHNFRNGQIDDAHLRLHQKTADALEALSKDQPGHDLLVLAAQFGLRHAGRSVRRARVVMTGNEFGLDSFAIGIMTLTHPIRLENVDDLWIDCPGAEFSPDGGGDFSESPCFEFYDGEVWFDTHDVDDADAYYGSASGFLPQ
jgi:hypothetical protein